MSDYDRFGGARYGASVARSATGAIDEGLRAFMLGVYNYMAIGLGLTGVVAYAAYKAAVVEVAGRIVGLTDFGAAIYTSPLRWLVIFAPLLVVFIFSAGRNSLSVAARKGDAFEVLEALASAGSRFDVVIVDPPAFAKRKKDLPKALAAYKRLNQLALRLLAGDGILVSCSCSDHVSAEDLEDAIAKAARSAGKHLQVLELGGQAPDHPVHPAIPETRYLKAYFCRVNDSLK